MSESEEIKNILESAKRLGVELDEADALQWLTAMSATQEGQIVMDVDTGVFGHKVSILDFSDADLEHFRKIGKIVEFYDIPGKVETALALSGSAAQSKIQTYPGDADFFERVNIIADSWEDACKALGDLMQDKIKTHRKASNYEMIELKMGSYSSDVRRNGEVKSTGSPISWTPDEALAGKFSIETMDGKPGEIKWDEEVLDAGWCKLDWVVAYPVRKQLVNASNMLDVTWEAPDGSITPLDGYLDSFFQEVYLDAESVPIFSKLVKHVSGNALDDYVAQLEGEVKKYVTKHPNYGKAAKRMYNVFRLTGRYVEAAFLRELFDEPTTMLYQVWALIRTVEESFKLGSEMDMDIILGQTDELILAVSGVLEGEMETEIIRQLLRFKDYLVQDSEKGLLSPQADAAREELINIVNNFFYEKLAGIPTIKTYMDSFQEG
ncbi:MAG: hypothetical protein HOF10_11340 [Chloroflexi bacterium]|nr:hypothetical protein [Chloroflexota bacterium]